MNGEFDEAIPEECLREEKLTEEQEDLIHQQWKLIEFIDLMGLDNVYAPDGLQDRETNDHNDFLIANAALHKLYSANQDHYSRVCNVLRLPNVLLFGSDAKGPDYTQSFLNMLTSPEVELFSQVLSHQEKRRQQFPTRMFDALAMDCLDRPGVSIEELVSAHSPGIDFRTAHVGSKSNGQITVFYDPKKIRNRLGNSIQVYSAEAVVKVAVYWKAPFGLKTKGKQ